MQHVMAAGAQESHRQPLGAGVALPHSVDGAAAQPQSAGQLESVSPAVQAPSPQTETDVASVPAASVPAASVPAASVAVASLPAASVAVASLPAASPAAPSVAPCASVATHAAPPHSLRWHPAAPPSWSDIHAPASAHRPAPDPKRLVTMAPGYHGPRIRLAVRASRWQKPVAALLAW
jgi:hypothetical protein